MDFLVVIGIIALVAISIYIVLKLNNFKSDDSEKQITLLQQQILDLNKQIDYKLTETNRSLNDQLSKSNTTIQEQFKISQKELQESVKTVKNVTEALTKVEETNKQIKGFAEQLQSLQDILRSPKQRGVLGEYYLDMVLSKVLPPEGYKLQYKFNNGELVDALIYTRNGNIPVDAKYTLDNYTRLTQAKSPDEIAKYEKDFKRDLQTRIDETSKYIRPDEGTLDFAFMFIPADGLFYEVLTQKIGSLDLNQQGLIEYAFKRKVIMVTPTTFFAYLQTVLQGLKSLQIEESAKEIRKHVDNLQKHLTSYGVYMDKVGKNLGTTVNAFNSAHNEFRKIDKDIVKITGAEETIVASQPLLDKPSFE